MKSQRKQLEDACKGGPQLDLFGASLSDMLDCIREVESFISDITEMSNIRKVWERNTVQEKFEDLFWKLDELQKSIQFGVMTEVRREIESNKKADKVWVLIDHVRNSIGFGAVSGRTTRGQREKTKGECRLM